MFDDQPRLTIEVARQLWAARGTTVTLNEPIITSEGVATIERPGALCVSPAMLGYTRAELEGEIDAV